MDRDVLLLYWVIPRGDAWAVCTKIYFLEKEKEKEKER
jgi:hypothetical protein